MFGVGFAPRSSGRGSRRVDRSIVFKFPTPKIKDARLANATVQKLKQRKLRMPIWSLDESRLRSVLFSDSAFDISGLDRSQFGWLCGFTTPEFAAGTEALVSLICWKSQRFHRKASSSLLCETLAFSKAVGALLWMVSFVTSLRITGYKHGDSLLLTSPSQSRQRC